MTFQCEYCKKTFKRESSISVHMCRQKQRWLQKDDQHVRLGLKFFNDWWRISMGAKKTKTYEDFLKSQYYGAFVKFGLYVLEARVLAPERYLAWLIEKQIRVDSWSRDSVYNKYLAEQSKKETAERALERFILHAEKWGEREGRHWTEYWATASTNRIVHDVKMGKISPWVLLSYPQAKSRLNEMPDALLNEIAETIDLAYWNRKIDVNRPTVDWIKEVMP